MVRDQSPGCHVNLTLAQLGVGLVNAFPVLSKMGTWS
jgi:hypothetical protein